MIWLLLIPAALLIGISKTSVGGLGSVAVAAFAFALPTRESTAAVLLLLITGDIVAVLRYRSHANWKMLISLLPWVLPGLALGAWFLSWVDDQTLRRAIGAMLMVSLIIQFITLWHTARTEARTGVVSGGSKVASSRLAAIVAGIAAGFTTMTANAAGPVMTVYLLATRINKMAFVGTSAWYYLIVNCSKVPFSIGLKLYTRHSLIIVASLVPVVIVGTFLGTRLLKALPQKVFERVAIGASVLAALVLLVR